MAPAAWSRPSSRRRKCRGRGRPPRRRRWPWRRRRRRIKTWRRRRRWCGPSGCGHDKEPADLEQGHWPAKTPGRHPQGRGTGCEVRPVPAFGVWAETHRRGRRLGAAFLCHEPHMDQHGRQGAARERAGPAAHGRVPGEAKALVQLSGHAPRQHRRAAVQLRRPCGQGPAVHRHGRTSRREPAKATSTAEDAAGPVLPDFLAVALPAARRHGGATRGAFSTAT